MVEIGKYFFASLRLNVFPADQFSWPDDKVFPYPVHQNDSAGYIAGLFL